jgi:hypothetical protein
MITAEILGGGLALLVAVTAGIVAHELSHALFLRAVGVSFDLRWFPSQDGATRLRASVTGGLASVQLREIPDDLSPWKLRAAALMPFLLSTPFVLVGFGIAPDPFQAGNAALSAAMVGWLGCALPSPQDFSMFWYAEQIINRGGEEQSHFDDESPL